MSWFFRRSLLVAGTAVIIGVASVVVWPGDPDGESLSLSHWLGIAGFVVTAALFVVAAISLAVAVVGGTWGASKFDPNEFLDQRDP